MKSPNRIMTLRQKALKGTSWSMLAFALTFSVQFIQFILLARFLDPSALGQVAVFTIINGFADILLGMGLAQAIIQRRRTNSRDLSSLYWLNLFVAFIIGAIVYLLSNAIADFLNSPEAHVLIKLTAPIFVISALGQTHKAVLEKRMLFARVALSESVAALFMLCTTSALLMTGAGAISAVIGLLVSAAIRTMVLNISGRRYFHIRLHFRASETKRYLTFGILQTLDSLITYATSSASTVATGRFVGGGSMGGYNLAFNTAVNLPARINPVITRVLFPVFAQIQDDNRRMGVNYLKVVSASSLISVPMLTCLALVAEEFVAVVYGTDWTWISPLIKVLCLVGILRSLGNPVGFLVQATDNLRLSLIVNIAKFVVTIPLVVYGAVTGGYLGAAYALLGAQIFGFVLTYCVVRTILNISVKRYSAACSVTLPMIVIMCLLLSGSGFVLQPIQGNDLVVLAIQILLAFIAVVSGLVFTSNKTLIEFRSVLLRRG